MSSIGSFLAPQKKEGEQGSGGRKAGTLICILQAAAPRPHGCLGICPIRAPISHTLRKTLGWDLSISYPGAPWVQCLGVSCRACMGKVWKQSLFTACLDKPHGDLTSTHIARALGSAIFLLAKESTGGGLTNTTNLSSNLEHALRAVGLAHAAGPHNPAFSSHFSVC